MLDTLLRTRCTSSAQTSSIDLGDNGGSWNNPLLGTGNKMKICEELRRYEAQNFNDFRSVKKLVRVFETGKSLGVRNPTFGSPVLRVAGHETKGMNPM